MTEGESFQWWFLKNHYYTTINLVSYVVLLSYLKDNPINVEESKTEENNNRQDSEYLINKIINLRSTLQFNWNEVTWRQLHMLLDDSECDERFNLWYIITPRLSKSFT